MEIKTPQEIMAEFRHWNGWGPPENQFQIEEYTRACAESEEEADLAEKVLTAWMHGKIEYKKPPLF
ncbi:MAG: hypothetical protein ACTSYO_07975 [Candidatus Ranarchaeia archaeon]